MRPEGGALSLQSRAVAANGDLLADYARLAVRVGVNLQPGQRLAINGLLEHAPLVRAATGEAYAAGASYVDVSYSDQHVRRAHVEGAADDMLGWSPPWLVERLRTLGEDGGALLSLSGNPEPDLFRDLDGGRVARARMREVVEEGHRLTDGLINWSIVSFPNEGWARTVFGEPDVDRLWQAVATAVRLDTPDPVAVLARAPRQARATVEGAEREAVRRDPLSRPGHGPRRSVSSPTRSGCRPAR